MDKKLTAGAMFICLLMVALSGCTTYNELAHTSDTLIFTPRDEKGTQGQVVYFKSSCSYFVVNTVLGYAVLRLVEGKSIRVGDVLTGDFESYGMKNIYNSSRKLSCNVMVENFWLSKDRAMEIYYEKCIQPEK